MLFKWDNQTEVEYKVKIESKKKKTIKKFIGYNSNYNNNNNYNKHNYNDYNKNNKDLDKGNLSPQIRPTTFFYALEGGLFFRGL